MNNLSNYNPDVLTCLANLSNDEVFTPPALVNEVLDRLPSEIWGDSSIKFLDPVSKSGVFLREITKRLINGLEDEIPDLQRRLEHVLSQQVFGFATTELTSLISRRTLYCSKYANGRYAVVGCFLNEQGNVTYNKIEHSWKNGSCSYCGASEGVLKRSDELENYAYQFIHLGNSEIKKMRFDVIVGNPPYQLNVGVEKKNHAVMIFQKFVETAISLQPRYISMIIPSRWFTGGRGLGEFRDKMLNDKRLREIVDYADSRECFEGVDIAGGAMYFLWDKNYHGDCTYTYVERGERTTAVRNLSKRAIFNRSPNADKIVDKVMAIKGTFLSEKVSVQTPFGLITTFWDKDEAQEGDVCVITSKGKTYTPRSKIVRNKGLIDKYKVITTAATSEHAGQSSKDGMRKVLARISILNPNEVCTQSYLVIDSFKSINEAKDCEKYLKTKFFRFLLLQAISSQHLSREKFCFVPDDIYRGFTHDAELYKYFKLDKDDIELIENSIKLIEN